MTDYVLTPDVHVTALVVAADELIEEWIHSLDLAADTCLTYRRCLERFTRWLEQERPGELSAPVIRRWRDSMGAQPTRLTCTWRPRAPSSPEPWREIVRDIGSHGTPCKLRRKGYVPLEAAVQQAQVEPEYWKPSRGTLQEWWQRPG